jgi:hypothetical protein
VLVLDDLQWADEASLAVWHELAASISQLRLLLIGTCRPTPRTPEVRQVRASVVRRSGQVIPSTCASWSTRHLARRLDPGTAPSEMP